MKIEGGGGERGGGGGGGERSLIRTLSANLSKCAVTF